MNISKTALAAAASVAAVVVAGSAALAANFSVLAASDPTGDLAATPTLVPAAATSESTIAPTTVAGVAPTTTVNETYAFQVEGVGVVTLERVDDGLAVVAVDIGPEWEWMNESRGPDRAALRFTSAGTELAFSAALEDGEVVVEVLDESPSPTTTPSTPSTPSTTIDDDSHGGDDHDSGGSSNSGSSNSGSSNSGSDDDDDSSYDD